MPESKFGKLTERELDIACEAVLRGMAAMAHTIHKTGYSPEIVVDCVCEAPNFREQTRKRMEAIAKEETEC